jgi:hypothetical protein
MSAGGPVKGVVMKGFVQDIEDRAVKNDDFRRVARITTSSIPEVFR